MDEHDVTFRWKDYRAKGRTRHKSMTLDADEFMRRFLLHVLPSGFHRIRHYGLLSNGSRRDNLARSRELLNAMVSTGRTCSGNQGTGVEHDGAASKSAFVCQHCGAAMIIVQTFSRWLPIRAPPTQPSAQ
jgi:hypothetical protein